jgi:hypothetical protein
MDEPLDYMSRAELQLNIMCNIERKVKELPKRNGFRWWWDNTKNWVRVQELLNMNTRKAGSTSSTVQCRFIGADPAGNTFYKE